MTAETEKKGLAVVTEKLFTKEDHFHVHKTLGILVLCSYLWRFSKIGEADMGFASHPAWTIPTVLLHVSLNLSSFEFAIPARRIKSGGRIWPEYRLHSLVFLCRSCVAVALRVWQRENGLGPNYTINWLIILTAMACADLASYSVGDNSSNSIRNVDAPVFVKYYFSIMQFGGTSFILCSPRCSLIFYYAFVVQFNPFCMTLVRKNLISHSTNMALYALELACGLGLALFEGFLYEKPDYAGYFAIIMMALMAAIWRMGPWPKWFEPFRNKYLIWTIMFVLFQRVLKPILEEPQIDGFMTPMQRNIRIVLDVETVAFFGFVAYKQWHCHYEGSFRLIPAQKAD